MLAGRVGDVDAHGGRRVGLQRVARSDVQRAVPDAVGARRRVGDELVLDVADHGDDELRRIARADRDGHGGQPPVVDGEGRRGTVPDRSRRPVRRRGGGHRGRARRRQRDGSERSQRCKGSKGRERRGASERMEASHWCRRSMACAVRIEACFTARRRCRQGTDGGAPDIVRIQGTSPSPTTAIASRCANVSSARSRSRMPRASSSFDHVGLVPGHDLDVLEHRVEDHRPRGRGASGGGDLVLGDAHEAAARSRASGAASAAPTRLPMPGIELRKRRRIVTGTSRSVESPGRPGSMGSGR